MLSDDVDKLVPEEPASTDIQIGESKCQNDSKWSSGELPIFKFLRLSMYKAPYCYSKLLDWDKELSWYCLQSFINYPLTIDISYVLKRWLADVQYATVILTFTLSMPR